MKMCETNGFKTIHKNYSKPNEFYLDKMVHHILTRALFETRTHVQVDPNTTLIDSRYYKVVYLRNENKYLAIGRNTEKLEWKDLPSSVKTMILRKEIELIVG